MLRVSVRVLARKVGAKYGNAATVNRGLALVHKSIALRRAAIEKALARSGGDGRAKRPTVRKPQAPRPHQAAKTPARWRAQNQKKPSKRESPAARPGKGAARTRSTGHTHKKLKKASRGPRKTPRKTFSAVSDASSWVSVMSKALKKRIERAVNQQQQRALASQRPRKAPPVVAPAKAAKVAAVPLAAQIAAFEVKDQRAIDAIIAEALPRHRSAVRAKTAVAAASPGAVKSTKVAAAAATAPAPVARSIASSSSVPASGLLPAPNTFLTRDWVELDCPSVVSRLQSLLENRARAVAPASPASTKPLVLRNPARTHLVNLDATNAYTQTLLATDTMEKRIRTQLHAPIFDDTMTLEKRNPLSRWVALSPAAENSDGSASTDATSEIVVVILSTCRPTEAAAVEAGWSSRYVDTSEKPLFSVAQLRAAPPVSSSSPSSSSAIPSIHLTSATIARVLILNATESRQYLAQTKARQNFAKDEEVHAAPISSTAKPSKSTKAKRGKSTIATPIPPPCATESTTVNATTTTTDTHSDVASLVEDALTCALENTKEEIATFVRHSVREAFAECEAVRQQRYDVAWRRYQQRLVSQASRRRSAHGDAALSAARQGALGTPAPVFLEASQQQIDDAVTKAVELAIGKLHNTSGDSKPE